MNNLWLAGVMGAVAGVIYFGAAAEVRDLRAGNAEVRREILELSSQEEVAEGRERRLESLVSLERVAVEKARARSVEVSRQTNLVSEAQEELGPEREGHWPGEKPYFYLSKALLKDVTFWPTTDDDLITPTAEVVLGLSREEKAGVNAAYKRKRERVREIELARAYPTNAPRGLETWEGKKTTLFVPAISKEEVKVLQGDFEADLARVIGLERAGLLANRIYQSFGYYAMAADRVLTVCRNGPNVTMHESDGRGNTSSSTYTTAGKQEVPRQFRHLFPNESQPSEP